MKKTYLQQYERMKRCYVRLETEYCRFNDAEKRLELEDLFYIFFQNSYHMRDWLLNSGIITKKEFEDEKAKMKSGLCKAMAICRDLANGSKHLTIRQPSVDSNLSLSHRTISQPNSPLKFLYLIEVPGKEVLQAIDLATVCALFWDKLLKSKNLL